MLNVVADEAAREDLAASLDEIVREGARRMLAAALEDEVAAYLAVHAAGRDEDGRRLVVRNGHARPRRVTTAAGAVEVCAAGERPAGRSGDGGADAVLLSALAAVVPQEPEDHRGAAAAVSARAVVHGRCPGAGAVPRLGGGPVGVGDHPADRGLAGGVPPLVRAATCPAPTTSTCGRTGCTSACGLIRTGCARWW
jgi:hypothetical protein